MGDGATSAAGSASTAGDGARDGHAAPLLYCTAAGCRRSALSGRPFARRSHLAQHIRCMHAERIHACRRCGRRFGARDRCRQHERDCGILLVCASCGKAGFRSRDSFMAHVRRSSGACAPAAIRCSIVHGIAGCDAAAPPTGPVGDRTVVTCAVGTDATLSPILVDAGTQMTLADDLPPDLGATATLLHAAGADALGDTAALATAQSWMLDVWPTLQLLPRCAGAAAAAPRMTAATQTATLYEPDAAEDALLSAAAASGRVPSARARCTNDAHTQTQWSATAPDELLQQLFGRTCE